MAVLQYFLSYLLNIDTYLFSFVAQYGLWTYVVLFLIVFCETGLVVTPFLPGDSLLFAAGSIAANENQVLSVQLLLVLLIVASVLGNKLNYIIGRAIGPRIFSVKSSWFFNPQHLQRAHLFYEKHGGKTIILARFLPIIRTFVPFVAGVAYMNIFKFNLYNILSGIIWVTSLLFCGYFFGKLPFIQQNFSIVIYAIIALSLLPPLVILIYQRIFNSAAARKFQ